MPELMREMCAASCGACAPSELERTPPSLRPVECGARVDAHTECDEWAAAGECALSARMRSECACACLQPRRALPTTVATWRAAGGGGGARCADGHENCAGWALAGVCEAAPLPMARLCARSCGACERRTAAADALEGGGAKAAVAPQLHRALAGWCAEAQRSVEEGGAAARPPPRAARPVALAEVRLAAGTVFEAAQRQNGDYLLDLSAERLLWSFYEVAGLPPTGEPYGGWEDAAKGGWPDPNTPTRTLRGHFVGHVLSALALGFAAGGDERLATRAAHLVGELRRCQLALATGFVSAWPASVLDALEAGRLSEVWAPYYTLHKILQGFLDVHTLVLAKRGDGSALAAAADLGSYLSRRVSGIIAHHGDDWWQALLEVEFGGIAQSAYQLRDLLAPTNASAAALALDLARAFRKRRFIEPLAAGHDILGGLHANTHLPTIVAAAAAVDAEAADAGEGDAARAAEGLRASVQAYCTLQLGYAYAGTAGSSVNEHWPRRAASTGAAYRTTFAPPDVEDVDAGGCGDLADAGACERSPEFMRAHCAATCAAEAAATRGGGGGGRERRRRRDGSVGFGRLPHARELHDLQCTQAQR